MIELDLLEELTDNKLVKYDEISKEEYWEIKNNPDADSYVYKKVRPPRNEYDSVKSYSYIKIKKEDLVGERLNTALLLLANKRQLTIKNQVGCLYAFMIFNLICSGIGIIIIISNMW